jgi:hypothetical protein
MRAAMMSLIVITVLVGWRVGASGQTPVASEEQPLKLIPTALQELNELRVNTGEKAMLRDGTRNSVYVTKTPSEGNIYLNFHVDVVSAAGPFVLHAREICLKTGGTTEAAAAGVDVTKGKTAPETPAPFCYTPFDWFLDTGLAEVHADSLTVNGMAVLQFTIEVPRADRDELTLFVRSQRVGTVSELRARVAREGEIK